MPADEVIDAARHLDNQRRLAEVEQRLDRIEERSRETLEGVGAIRALIGQLDVAALREMADAMNSMKGGVRVLGWLERPAKWLAAIAGAVVAVYGLMKLKG